VIEVELTGTKKKFKGKTPSIEPNITSDTIFKKEGVAIGLYIKKIPEKLSAVTEFANREALTDRVPKQEMSRGPQGTKESHAKKNIVTQYSIILGGVPASEIMRRPKPNVSSVHREKTAARYVQAIITASRCVDDMVSQYLPEAYKKHKESVLRESSDKYRVASVFTSFIHNMNISVDYHIDKHNIPDSLNVIIIKKYGCQGGDLSIPEQGVCLSCTNDSMIVYPAWMNYHGVTPITNSLSNGYRNSLVFYSRLGLKD
jgi:hypothetical protein